MDNINRLFAVVSTVVTPAPVQIAMVLELVVPRSTAPAPGVPYLKVFPDLLFVTNTKFVVFGGLQYTKLKVAFVVMVEAYDARLTGVFKF